MNTFSIYERFADHWRRTHKTSAPNFDIAKRAARDYAATQTGAPNGPRSVSMLVVCDSTRATWLRVFGYESTEWRAFTDARSLCLVE